MARVSADATSLGEALAPVLADRDAPAALRAALRWCIRILGGLPERLANSGASLASGVDLVAVEVRNVTPSGPLWRTLVSDGRAEYGVMTNLPGIRRGQVLAAAFLPPREVGGVVSEAMFLGAEPRTEAPGAVLAEEEVDAREAASILHDELGRR
jgi:predicted RNA-binding protein with EMAP domain